VPERNATAAVIGAGDYIGAAIARRFAAAGFTVFAGRRNGDRLASLVADIEAAGGRIVARSLDARKEEEIVAFLADADRHAPLEVCIFNVGANVNFPLLETTERVFRSIEPDQLMRPESVAEAYWALYQQPRDAWTFEHEIRPFAEKW
jgi:NAD(P)-dependent dehydrogenase (short-subunit alcohol dehydrogenase family)